MGAFLTKSDQCLGMSSASTTGSDRLFSATCGTGAGQQGAGERVGPGAFSAGKRPTAAGGAGPAPRPRHPHAARSAQVQQKVQEEKTLMGVLEKKEAAKVGQERLIMNCQGLIQAARPSLPVN